MVNRGKCKIVSVAAMTLLVAGGWAAGADDAEWIDAFAAELHRAWQAGEPMPQLSVTHPDATLEDGYRVQERLVERMFGTDGIGGFKAAGISQNARDRNKIDGPLTGVIPASGVLDADDSIVIDLSADSNRHVETEMGYIFATPIAKPLPDVDALRERVKHVVPIIEVPGNPTENKVPGTPADLLAWNINAKELIVGPRHDPAEVDVDAIAITLTRDGAVVNTAKSDEAAGGQWDTLLKSVNDVVRRGYTVEAGHVITNGAVGKILKAEPGHYRAEFKPLGVIEFDVK
jgi:2-keto-4-pentenoate hydratase